MQALSKILQKLLFLPARESSIMTWSVSAKIRSQKVQPRVATAAINIYRRYVFEKLNILLIVEFFIVILPFVVVDYLIIGKKQLNYNKTLFEKIS